MKDWKNLIADENRIIGKHYTPGRAGHTIDKVVIHHNAGVLSIADCYNTWQTRQASAHYQVETGGRIGQLVYDRDTAWHAANLLANQTSIGIEHANSGGPAQDWPVSEATRENGAHLVAAICLYYGLGRPQWMVNVFPHKRFGQTACPYHLADAYRDAYMRRAGEWYDAMKAGSAAPAGSASSVRSMPSAAKPTADALSDGVWGPATTKSLQRLLGTPQDGVISSQDQGRRGNVPAAGDGWEWVADPQGSQAIKEYQSRLGVAADGIIGPGTIRRLQNHLGVPVDGYAGVQTVKALQAKLSRGAL